jgi:glucose-1-phosphate cytidylyltransferase
MENIPVVILAGGMGMRLHELTDKIPKALVPIGNMPIVLHIMKIYAHYGFKKFIFCLGYKGELIREYFLKHDWINGDLKLIFGKGKKIITSSTALKDFEISFIDTGLYTPTGGRIKKIEKHITTDNFFCTYSDGLADINIKNLLEFHIQKGKVATLTAVHPMSPFGVVEVDDNSIVTSFKEKPFLPGLINGGFFVFNRKIFDYLDDNSVLEEEPLRKLTQEKQLAAYQHKGFWACMDTYKDYERLNKLWEEGVMPHTGFKGKPPWKIWE